MSGIVSQIDCDRPRAVFDPNGPGGEVIITPLEHRMLWWVRDQLSGAPEYLQRTFDVLNTYLRESCQHHWRDYPKCCTPPKDDCDPPHRQCLWCHSVEELSTDHASQTIDRARS